MATFPSGLEPERVLGRGASSTVYRARRTNDGRVVAVKALRVADLASAAANRFAREADIMRALHHPNLVQLEELCDVGEQRFLVMEYVDGATLADVMPVDTAAVAAGVIAELAGALDVVHQAGVLHRDVKPANVLVARDGTCKLADFGVARFIGDSMLVGDRNRLRTRTGTVLGTPRYMAPEVAAGVRDIDARADLYSLAVLAYVLLVRRPPFEGDAYSVIEAQIHKKPPPPVSVAPGLPREVDDVFERSLAKSPSDRFATGAEFAGALAAALEVAIATDIAPDLAAAVAGRALLRDDADDAATEVGVDESLPQLPRATAPAVRLRTARARHIRRIAVSICGGVAVGAGIVVLLHH